MLDNKYYTAPLAFTKLSDISQLQETCDFQAIILDDSKYMRYLSNDIPVFYMGTSDPMSGSLDDMSGSLDGTFTLIDPIVPNALSLLKAELDLIDWNEKTIKSLKHSQIDVFEQLLQFKRGDDVEKFVNLLNQIQE